MLSHCEEHKNAQLPSLLNGLHVSLKALEQRSVLTLDCSPKTLNMIRVDSCFGVHKIYFFALHSHGHNPSLTAFRIIQLVCPHT